MSITVGDSESDVVSVDSSEDPDIDQVRAGLEKSSDKVFHAARRVEILTNYM